MKKVFLILHLFAFVVGFKSYSSDVEKGYPKMHGFREIVAFWLDSRRKDMPSPLAAGAVVDIGRYLIKPYLPKPWTDFEGESCGMSDVHSKLTVSIDGRYLGDDVTVWDMEDQQAKPLFLSKAPHEFISAIAFSPDSMQIGAAYCDLDAPDVFRLLDVQQGSTIYELPTGDRCDNISFAPNGRYINVTEGGWGSPVHILLIDRNNLQAQRQLQPNESFVSTSFSPDSNFFALGKFDEAILYDLQNPEQEPIILKSGSEKRVLFSPDSNSLVCRSSGNVFTVWNMQNLQEKPTVFDVRTADSVFDVSFSPKGDFLSIAVNRGSYIYDMKRKFLRWLDRDSALKSTFSLDGKYLVSCLRNKKIKVIDVGAPSKTLQLSGEEFTDLKFLPNGKHFVTSSDKGTKIWNWQAIKRRMPQRDEDEEKG